MTTLRIERMIAEKLTGFIYTEISMNSHKFTNNKQIAHKQYKSFLKNYNESK